MMSTILPRRMSSSEERQARLFARYHLPFDGLIYSPSVTNPDHDPRFFGIDGHGKDLDLHVATPRRVLRVQKPIRMRVHWSCHSCSSRFGAHRTCAHCGHRKCRLCPRSPAPRVKDILEELTMQREQEQQVVRTLDWRYGGSAFQPASPLLPPVSGPVEGIDISSWAREVQEVRGENERCLLEGQSQESTMLRPRHRTDDDGEGRKLERHTGDFASDCNGRVGTPAMPSTSMPPVDTTDLAYSGQPFSQETADEHRRNCFVLDRRRDSVSQGDIVPQSTCSCTQTRRDEGHASSSTFAFDNNESDKEECQNDKVFSGFISDSSSPLAATAATSSSILYSLSSSTAMAEAPGPPLQLQKRQGKGGHG